MGRAVGAYLRSLMKGDPEAIWFTIAVLVAAFILVAAVLIVTWRAKAEERRYKQGLKNRRGY